jgi:hypothetical protein
MIRKSIFAASFAFVGALASAQASAAEISLMEGFYKSTKVRDGLESTSIILGGRYLDSLGGKMSWYGDFGVGIKSYSAPSNEPGNQTDIKIGGGVRMKLVDLNEKVFPYLTGGGFYKSETSQPNWSPAATSWDQESGLFYDGWLGLHFSLATDFFMALESNLFTSALSAKTTHVTKAPTGETKVEEDRVDLYVDTVGAFNDTRVALGLKF